MNPAGAIFIPVGTADGKANSSNPPISWGREAKIAINNAFLKVRLCHTICIFMVCDCVTL